VGREEKAREKTGLEYSLHSIDKINRKIYYSKQKIITGT
jgi:hypothetical protein